MTVAPDSVLERDHSVTRLAPAKVNLALHVTGRRADGYHLIETLAVFTRFGDRLTVAAARSDGFDIRGSFADALASDTTNLVIRARDALRAAYGGRAAAPAHIVLEKNLPVASGIGGGSSDAAAALSALSDFWGLGASADDLARIGLSLGADVPMCLAARPLVAGGVGEILSSVPGFPALGLVLVNPGVPVSTADVFAALSRRDNGALPPLPATIDFHSLRDWLGRSRNDLEAPAAAIAPQVGRALSTLNRFGAGFSRMSGSGATCFGLYETGNVAKRAAAQIRSANPGWFVAATRSMASGDNGNDRD